MHRKTVALLSPILTILLLGLALPALAGFDEQRSFSSDTLTVNNLIGEVRVTGHGGSTFEVQVSVRGSDASRDLIRIRTEEGGKPEICVYCGDCAKYCPHGVLRWDKEA